MHAENKSAFFTAWSTMIELQAGKELSDRALRLAFDLLKEYELDEVKHALRIHCHKSPYIAKPADIILIIKGEVPSNAELYGLAQSADTILGAYVRYLVGDHDVTKLTARDASARVASLRQSIIAFVENAQAGMLTDDQIRVLGAKGFDVWGELCPGLPGARVVHYERLKTRQAELVKVQIAGEIAGETASDVEQRREKRTEAEKLAGQQKLAQIMSTLKGPAVEVRAAS